MITLSIAILLTTAIGLYGIVGHEIAMLATELGNSLRVAVAGILGRNGRHVGRDYRPRHTQRPVTL